MSDKTVGVLGQKYEDRKTGKCGVLESRDEKYKTLTFRGEDGSTFNVSNSSFRSNWRKVKDDVIEPEVTETEEVTEEVESEEEVTEPEVEEEVTEPESEIKPKKRKSKSKFANSQSRKSYEGISNDTAITTFIEEIMVTRKVEVGIGNEDNCMTILVDDCIVTKITNSGDGIFTIAMLPDIFTLTDWRGVLKVGSMHYKVGAENYLGIVVDTYPTCIPEILDIITETVRDINLYGYIEEEEESNEEV